MQGPDILCQAKVRTSKNDKYPKSRKFNRATNHEMTNQEAKIAKVANETIVQFST